VSAPQQPAELEFIPGPHTKVLFVEISPVLLVVAGVLLSIILFVTVRWLLRRRRKKS
jgi:hypothetical protein